MIYPINNIYACIQGEGCRTGIPMVMLRLQGCDVGCPWCDTKETWVVDPSFERMSWDKALEISPTYIKKSSSEIAHYIKPKYPLIKWVLVSGGEPAQYPLGSLVAALHDVGYLVALETSGTETGHLGAGVDWVCVSPKVGMPGGKTIQPETLANADEIKYVVGKSTDIQTLDQLINQNQLKEDCVICLQPVSQSPKATQLCIQMVEKRGWRLSIQIHKYLDLP